MDDRVFSRSRLWLTFGVLTASAVGVGFAVAGARRGDEPTSAATVSSAPPMPTTTAAAPATTTVATTTVTSTVAATTTTPAQPPEAWGEILERVLDRHLLADGLVGATIRLRHPDGPVVERSAGTQTPGAQAPAVDPQVAWGIGSVTKAFVATVVLQLADEGQVELDAPVSRWLPDLADGERITIRQLLRHESGLNEYIDTAEVQSGGAREWQPAELLALAEARGRFHLPGAAFHYSNTNYVVLGELIEAVTGRAWPVVVAERVTGPLGLTRTGPMTASYAPGYAVIDGTYVDQTGAWDWSVGGAAGGMQSTAANLAEFGAALADGRLLSPAMRSEAEQFVAGNDLSAFGVVHSYGLGLERYEVAGRTVIGHLGTGNTHSAFVGYDAGSGVVVAVTLNTAEPGPQGVIAIEALIEAVEAME